jgi:hypothetical protein
MTYHLREVFDTLLLSPFEKGTNGGQIITGYNRTGPMLQLINMLTGEHPLWRFKKYEERIDYWISTTDFRKTVKEVYNICSGKGQPLI